jgi:hypothetical protein
MSGQHTPGPWVIDWNVSRLDIFSSTAETLIATVRRSTLSSGMDETAKANARLIAALPELLEMLRISVEVLKKVTPSDDPSSNELLTMTIETSLAVIAKATGEQS